LKAVIVKGETIHCPINNHLKSTNYDLQEKIRKGTGVFLELSTANLLCILGFGERTNFDRVSTETSSKFIQGSEERKNSETQKQRAKSKEQRAKSKRNYFEEARPSSSSTRNEKKRENEEGLASKQDKQNGG